MNERMVECRESEREESRASLKAIAERVTCAFRVFERCVGQ